MANHPVVKSQGGFVHVYRMKTEVLNRYRGVGAIAFSRLVICFLPMVSKAFIGASMRYVCVRTDDRPSLTRIRSLNALLQ